MKRASYCLGIWSVLTRAGRARGVKWRNILIIVLRGRRNGNTSPLRKSDFRFAWCSPSGVVVKVPLKMGEIPVRYGRKFVAYWINHCGDSMKLLTTKRLPATHCTTKRVFMNNDVTCGNHLRNKKQKLLVFIIILGLGEGTTFNASLDS